ncbi:MAG: hypothetical protein AMJ73_03940 [candidate division Zixibacteria bacterium SM1_73]|nr:MAG: hypothetical protein AMJ73_03940 [candidate division Zixibacteria bacterium SM1_73]
MLKISLVKKTLSILTVLIIFFMLGRILYLNIETLLKYDWQFKYHLLFPSLLFLALNYLIAAHVWTQILKMLGYTINLPQSFKITYLSAAGKYIPGKIWTYVSQIYLADKVGLPRRLTLVSMASMFVAYNGIAILFFISTLLLWESIPTHSAIILILLFSLVLLFILHPQVLTKAINFFLRFFKKEKVEFKVAYKSMLFLLGLLILDRVIFSIFAYLFINSFLALNLIEAIKFSGVFSVAVFLGVMTFIAPGGLGVREGVQSYLLSLFLPVSMAILIALAMRVWMTLGELACFLVALKIKEPELT